MGDCYKTTVLVSILCDDAWAVVPVLLQGPGGRTGLVPESVIVIIVVVVYVVVE